MGLPSILSRLQKGLVPPESSNRRSRALWLQANILHLSQTLGTSIFIISGIVGNYRRDIRDSFRTSRTRRFDLYYHRTSLLGLHDFSKRCFRISKTNKSINSENGKDTCQTSIHIFSIKDSFTRKPLQCHNS